MMIDNALANLKITALNEMQKDAIKAYKTNSSVVLLSPTGSGKTLAFLLPVAENLDASVKNVQALVLAPSRELAIQIEQVFKSMGTGFKVNCCYGGHMFKIERNNLAQPPAVLIGTPGRIADHIRRGTFSTADVRILILDEFDKALELGFKDEMSFIIDNLKGIRKRVLTSATDIEEIPDFAGVDNPAHVNFLSGATPIKLKFKTVVSPTRDKLDALFALICVIGNAPTLVFCNHREAVERISGLLQQRGMAHGIFHGGLEQDDRERALIKFRNGSHHILLTTDLASRGLDIPEIENVIHYQLPATESVYVHRNGRTARMHASGTSYMILGEDEYVPAFITEEAEKMVLPIKYSLPEKTKWITLYIGAGKKDKINKVDIVGLLLQKGKLDKDELGRVEVLDNSAYAAVKRSKANSVVSLVKEERIKNKKVKIAISE